MYTGEISFTLLRVFGMWRPSSWNSGWKTVYSVYSATMLFGYSTFLLSLLMYLLRVAEDIDSFTFTILYFLAACAIMVKMVNILSKRKTVIETENLLADPLCLPRDGHETEILRKYSETVRSNTIIFLIMTNTSVAVRFFAPLAQEDHRLLPLKAWIPYSLDSRSVFLLTYFYQGLFLVMSACVTTGVECLALMMMLQICAQIEIIAYRLHLFEKTKNSPESVAYHYESRFIKDCAHHHTKTYSLGNKLNELFGIVIFAQFCASMIDLCTILYQLSRFSLDNKFFWEMIPLLGTVTVQIFLYCFYGEKMTDKSLKIVEAIYQMDWPSVTNKSRKDLVLIMMRASRPMKLSGASIIIMSLETFVKIMKSAYSAYNLLCCF